ncbi:MAG: hypothetical protein HY650_03555 [Acidobacteria bacterium]|nr:hypothetical protein [Acidobacteriota bacterium]
MIWIGLISLYALSASLAPKTGATAEDPPSYVGLWEAVDPDDGGHQVLSITRNTDGTFQLLLRDTYYTLCDGTAVGISRGTGRIDEHGNLVCGDFTLRCLATGETRLTPTSFHFLDAKGTLLDRNRTEPLADMVYHRTSGA